jgi:hypothetical protein
MHQYLLFGCQFASVSNKIFIYYTPSVSIYNSFEIFVTSLTGLSYSFFFAKNEKFKAVKLMVKKYIMLCGKRYHSKS